MLIQKDLEAKIVSAIQTALTTANVSDVVINGAWQTSLSGLVKWIEGDLDDPAFLSVSVGSPSWQTFTTPMVNFTVTLALFIRTELDPTGTKLAAVAEVIENLLRGWQTSTYQSSFTALDLTNLSVDGIALGGGSSPIVNGSNATVNWSFTLSGSYRESSTNN